MEINQPISLPSSDDPPDSVFQCTPELDDDVISDLNNLQIDTNSNESDSKQIDEENHDDEDDSEDDEDDSDFTFICSGDTDSSSSEVFESGQIRPVFPLFDQSLLLNSGYDDEKRINVPVNNVFFESPRSSPSSEYENAGGVASAIVKESESGKQEINIKSNSTGFSKLWRFKNEMNRSNSDGRDAYVFLHNREEVSTSSNDVVDRSIGKVKVNDAGVGVGGKLKAVKKGPKLKKATASAHEMYLKQKAGQSEEERRKSYLPYRPGLMGFFTNVNGGLSKNVHPF